MTIDDAEWHTDSVLDLGLDPSAAAIHIGVALAWMSTRGLLAPAHGDTAADALERVGTPSSYARRHFVAQFGSWDLTEHGAAFLAAAYPVYLRGISGVPDLPWQESFYQVPDTWETYDAVAPLLDTLYAEWGATRD